MTLLDWFDRRHPRLAFARRIPPQQIWHRFWLKWRDRLFGVRFARLSPQTRLRNISLLPPPTFAPRPINVQRTESGWSFTFLQRTVTVARTVDWQAPGTGPRDQLWRMNLHYFEYLDTLPMADGLALIEQWIAANPATRPNALSDAWNSYALSLRLVCWIHWLSIHGGAVAQPTLSTIEGSMLQQLAFLETHLERDVGGNHLIKNIKALLIAAAAFDGPDAARWQRLGTRLLISESARQILRDAMHFELSPSYHCQVTADLIEVCASAPSQHLASLSPTLRSMVHNAQTVSHPDGFSAQFNDSGQHMAYAPAALAQAASDIGLIAELPGERQSAWLTDSGYLAWHDGDDSLIVKARHIAPDALPAHGHGDLGSIELSVNGRRCIVDQGVFEYIDGDARSVSRSAASHNVVQVGDLDQAAFFGAFRMGWRARAEAKAEITTDNVARLSLSHPAFAHACGMVQRTIEARRGKIVISDRIERATQLPVVSRLLLHPDWDVRIEDASICLSYDEATILIAVDGARVSVMPAIFWPDMGAQCPATRLQFLWEPMSIASQLTLSWDKRAPQ